MSPPVSPAPGSESRGYAAVIPAGSLTPREWQLLRLLAEGHTYAEAGRRMGIALQTVKNHATAIYSALDAPNLVGAFLRLSWLHPVTATSNPTWAAETPHDWSVW